MAFENKSIESVNNLIVNGLEAELNTKFRLLPKAFVRVLAKVLSAVYITLYRQQAWIFLQLFVATASFDEISVMGKKVRPLVMWGQLVNVGEPDQATMFEGVVRVKVVEVNTYLMQGTQFVNPATNKIYTTTENVLLRGIEQDVKVRCAEAGTVGNVVADDVLNTVSSLYNIERKAVVKQVLNEAVDAESEDHYRKRVQARWKVQPQGGALSDYRSWANDVAGVLQSYIYKDDDTASGVLIYVAATNDSRIAAPELLVQVGKECTRDPVTGRGRKPIGAILDPLNNESYKNVRACSVTGFDVRITGYSGAELSSFVSSVKTYIDAYFKGREPFVRGLDVDTDRRDRISVNNVSGIVNEIAESLNGYYDSVEIVKGAEVVASYELGRGELVKLNNLYVNGVIV